MNIALQMFFAAVIYVLARKVIGEPFAWYEAMSLGSVSGMIALAWWKYVIGAKP